MPNLLAECLHPECHWSLHLDNELMEAEADYALEDEEDGRP